MNIPDHRQAGVPYTIVAGHSWRDLMYAFIAGVILGVGMATGIVYYLTCGRLCH